MSPRKKVEENFSKFIHNKYFLGIILLLVNIGSKYLGITLSPAQEKFFKLWYVRCFIFFCVFFSATKDFLVSIFLVTFFYVVFNTILNEDSKVCILPQEAIDNKTPTDTEYNNCKKIVKDYEDSKKDD